MKDELDKTAPADDVATSLEDVLLAFESDASVRSEATERGLSRLMHAVSQPPLRYAPFFERLAEHFDLTQTDVVALLAREDWKGTGLPGVHSRSVRPGPKRLRQTTYLLRLAAGAYLPRHIHDGEERALILEGSYFDDDGVEHVAGDLHVSPDGTAHSLRVAPALCIVAVTQESGYHFVSRALRLALRWFRN